jgi:hypothetical protein
VLCGGASVLLRTPLGRVPKALWHSLFEGANEVVNEGLNGHPDLIGKDKTILVSSPSQQVPVAHLLIRKIRYRQRNPS